MTGRLGGVALTKISKKIVSSNLISGFYKNIRKIVSSILTAGSLKTP